MNRCPPITKLHDYVGDLLDPREDQFLTEHVQGCALCTATLAKLVAPSVRRTNGCAKSPCPHDLFDRLSRLWRAEFTGNERTAPESWPRIEGYEIRSVLGRGGMGIVYRAWQTALGREVALKMIAAGERSSAADVRRLLNDATTAAQLRHDHIVPVHAVGEHRGLPYCVMELVAGGSLAQRVTDLVNEPRETARLIAAVARALDHAHAHGVYHRDIKPANILLRVRVPQTSSPRRGDDAVAFPLQPALCDLNACVTDFGLAKRAREEAGLTLEGAVVGTPGYVAPEQIRSEAPTARADLFGLGAVLYECLTGQAPFRGATHFDTLLLTLHAEPQRPRVLNSRLPRDLETVCLKCLEKDPRRRYPSAGALAADLERWLHGEPVTARPVGPLGRLWRWGRRKPLPALLSMALVAIGCVAFAVCGWFWHQAVKTRNEAVAARAEAEDHFRRTRQLLPDFVAAGGGPWQQVAEHRRARRAALERAGGLYRELCRARPADRELRGEFADVLADLAKVTLEEEDYEAAGNAAEEALAQWSALREEAPAEPRWRSRRADALSVLVEVHQGCDRYPEMDTVAHEALAVYQQLADEDPDDAARVLAVADARNKVIDQSVEMVKHIAAVSMLEDNRRYLTAYLDKGHESCEVRLKLVSTLAAQGGQYEWRGDHAAALRCWHEATQRGAGLADALPKNWAAWICPTQCARRLPPGTPGALTPQEAVPRLEQGVRLLDAGCALDPGNLPNMIRLAHAHSTLADCYASAGRPVDALAAQRRAAAVKPARPLGSARMELERMMWAALVAVRERDAGEVEASQLHAREVADDFETFCRAHREDPIILAEAVEFCSQLAPPLRHAGANDQSRRVVERSLSLARQQADVKPDAAHLCRLASAWTQLAKCRMRDDPEGVEAALTAAVDGARRFAALGPENKYLLDDRLNRLARFLRGNGRRAEAAACLRECEGLWPGDADGLCGVARGFRELADEVTRLRPVLSPAEVEERRRYLAEAARLEMAADSIGR
jgi:hypothetical protein